MTQKIILPPTRKSIVSSTTIVSWILKLSIFTVAWLSCSEVAWSKVDKVKIPEKPKFSREEETVNLRVKVEDEYQRPIDSLSLSSFDIEVDGKPVPFKPQNFKNPRSASTPPARIVILIDMSGSMNRPAIPGSSQTKLQASIEAIEKMSDQAAAKGSDIRFSLVPFGVEGSNCPKGGYVVDSSTLNNFELAGSQELQDQLGKIRRTKPCASTDLYNPILNAVQFLSNSENSELYPPEKSDKTPPRLGIILLTDGFHNQGNDRQLLGDLKNVLTSNPDLTVFTLGYGLNPRELQQKFAEKCQLTRPVTRADLRRCSDLEPEFTDEQPLKDIAKWGNGFAQFGGNPTTIANNFLEALRSLLGEYQITFAAPKPRRGTTYSVKVAVDGVDAEQPRSYLVDNFGRTPERLSRYLSGLGTLTLLGVAGWLPFYFWGKNIANNEES